MKTIPSIKHLFWNEVRRQSSLIGLFLFIWFLRVVSAFGFAGYSIYGTGDLFLVLLSFVIVARSIQSDSTDYLKTRPVKFVLSAKILLIVALFFSESVIDILNWSLKFESDSSLLINFVSRSCIYLFAVASGVLTKSMARLFWEILLPVVILKVILFNFVYSGGLLKIPMNQITTDKIIYFALFCGVIIASMAIYWRFRVRRFSVITMLVGLFTVSIPDTFGYDFFSEKIAEEEIKLNVAVWDDCVYVEDVCKTKYAVTDYGFQNKKENSKYLKWKNGYQLPYDTSLSLFVSFSRAMSSVFTPSFDFASSCIAEKEGIIELKDYKDSNRPKDLVQFYEKIPVGTYDCYFDVASFIMHRAVETKVGLYETIDKQKGTIGAYLGKIEKGEETILVEDHAPKVNENGPFCVYLLENKELKEFILLRWYLRSAEGMEGKVEREYGLHLLKLGIIDKAWLENAYLVRYDFYVKKTGRKDFTLIVEDKPTLRKMIQKSKNGEDEEYDEEVNAINVLIDGEYARNLNREYKQ